jgi:hypothetical protein
VFGFSMTIKVFFVPERSVALIDGAFKWWIVLFAMRVKKMPLWKCQPAFVASQGIIDGLHVSIEFRRLHM